MRKLTLSHNLLWNLQTKLARYMILLRRQLMLPVSNITLQEVSLIQVQNSSPVYQMQSNAHFHCYSITVLPSTSYPLKSPFLYSSIEQSPFSHRIEVRHYHREKCCWNIFNSQ